MVSSAKPCQHCGDTSHNHNNNNSNKMEMDTENETNLFDISTPGSFSRNVSTRWSFYVMQAAWRKRKRREVDEDNVSVQSLNIHPCGEAENKTGSLDRASGQSDKKGKRSMTKISSLANMLSPATNKVQKAFERSFSFKTPSSPATTSSVAVAPTASRPITPYKKPKPVSSSERRTTRLWSETVQLELLGDLNAQEIKRQEAIHELVQGEADLIDDLTMVHKLYHNSMRKLKLLNDEELDSIFGIVARLVPLHEGLLKRLSPLRQQNGVTEAIGDTLLDWVENLRHYETYCANQVFAKGLLDYKKTDPKVEDFLSRCQESSFSRKLDLWNFLDLPRSRLVKYPLLLKQIQKYTPEGHEDSSILTTVISLIEDIIHSVDIKMGHSKCQQALKSLDFPYETTDESELQSSTALICSGQLKNDRGTKLHVFLFDKALIVARQATRNGQLKYQVLKQPIPVSQLSLNDMAETEGKKGSFKNKVLRQPSTDKHTFKVWNKSDDNSSHLLHTRDEHDKRQWISSIQQAIDQTDQSKSSTSSGQSRQGSVSSLEGMVSLSSDEETEMLNKLETVV